MAKKTQTFDGYLAALDDDQRTAALVGIFHLRLHAGCADIHFGANAAIAQRRR